MMGLIGIIIASIVNAIWYDGIMSLVISVIGVIVFTGLTAYDTQRIKQTYVETDGQALMLKKSVMGALSLYLNFINLFVMLLHLFGGARE